MALGPDQDFGRHLPTDLVDKLDHKIIADRAINSGHKAINNLIIDPTRGSVTTQLVLRKHKEAILWEVLCLISAVRWGTIIKL